MKRYLLGVMAVVLVAAACSGGNEIAATVNGTEIDASTVEGLVTPTEEPLSDERFVEALIAVVQWNAITDAAREQFAIDPTAEEIAAQADRIFAAQGAGRSREEYLELQQVSEEGFALYAAQLLIGEQILGQLETRVEQPTAAEAQQLLVENPKSFTLVCAAHILVATEQEAAAVSARLEAGEQFAALAAELSLDGSGAAGGELTCTPPTEWVTAFGDAALAAEIGEVTDPVQSEFGFHLILVNSRTEATTEELQSALADVRLSEIVEEWYFAAVTGADVTVDERYGTWQTDPIPTIVRPAS